MAAGPLAIGLRADVERHLDAVAGVVTRTTHLGEIPARSEIARTPFAVGFKATAGKDDRRRTHNPGLVVNDYLDALDTLFTAQELGDACTVTHVDAVLLGGAELCFDETSTAAIGINHHAAEELELAVDVIGLASVIRHEADAATAQPMHCVRAAADDRICQLRIDVVLRDGEQIVEVFLAGIVAEIRSLDFVFTQIGNDLADVFDAVVNHAETTASEGGVAAALFLGSPLQNNDPGTCFAGR